MSRIKNISELASSQLRSDMLAVLEAGYAGIDTQTVVQKALTFSDGILTLEDVIIDTRDVGRILFFGFGKGSSRAACAVRDVLGTRLTGGVVIDKEPADCLPIQSFVGNHPMPGEQSREATRELERVASGLTEKDLVIVAAMGGGSALLVSPDSEATDGAALYKALLTVGANTREQNLIRKHIGALKGGGLAKLLYPAQVLSLIFSDVPGGHYEDVASGPTYHDESTAAEAEAMLAKFNLAGKFNLVETPKDEKYFKRVTNKVLVSNESSLAVMAEEAERLGYKAVVIDEPLYGGAEEILARLGKLAGPGTIVLDGGEVHLLVSKVTGVGGRCSYLGLTAASVVTPEQLLVAAASDGSDNGTKAGVLVDSETLARMQAAGVDVKAELANLNTLPPFEKIGDVLDTGRTGANVSDWYILATVKQ
ncbi:MAG TPA: DUF4147 domain-containing protein [Candidatus Paceibacterota bacterium]